MLERQLERQRHDARTDLHEQELLWVARAAAAIAVGIDGNGRERSDGTAVRVAVNTQECLLF